MCSICGVVMGIQPGSLVPAGQPCSFSSVHQASEPFLSVLQAFLNFCFTENSDFWMSEPTLATWKDQNTFSQTEKLFEAFIVRVIRCSELSGSCV